MFNYIRQELTVTEMEIDKDVPRSTVSKWVNDSVLSDHPLQSAGILSNPQFYSFFQT